MSSQEAGNLTDGHPDVRRMDINMWHEILTSIKATLQSQAVEYERHIDELGQVAASKLRLSGKPFAFEQHLRGLILAQLSHQRPWAGIQANLGALDKVFCDYDRSRLRAIDPKELQGRVQELRCGNRAIARQMAALAMNIETLESIESTHGSLDAFVVSASPDRIARKLSDPGPYTIRQLGVALALEYLRNVGVRAVKPDVHIRRFLGPERLGLTAKHPSEDEAYRALEAIAEATDLNATYLDNLLWIFCASKYGAICGARPRCEVCHLSARCNYARSIPERELT